MKDTSVIKIEKVTKSYKLYEKHSDRVKEVFHPFRKRYHRRFDALKDVNFTIKRGETIGLIGRNGSGKSTLLQIICGIIEPARGEVTVTGRISAILELGAGFNPEYTGRQNVYLNCSILGLDKHEIDNRFPEISEFADIGDFIDQPVKVYSSGMYVRLAFAVAINVDPDIIIVDEALAVGDSLFQAKCFAKFKEFQKRNVTILFVTHALDMITSYCTRAFLLEKGEIISRGDPKKIVDKYNRLIIGHSPSEDENHNSKSRTDSIENSQDKFNNNPKENRYGNGKVEIVEGGVFNEKGLAEQCIKRNETYEIRLKILFKADINNPIFAFTIKDIKGFAITGTNTLFKNVETGLRKRGDFVICVFEQKICLNPGSYLLSLGCAGYENGKYVVYERRYDYMLFDVISDQHGVGFFDMDSKIKIKEIN